MDYKLTLTKYKEKLEQQLFYKTALLKKYDLPGYINIKKINGHQYEYYQYRADNDEMVSIRLTGEKKKIYSFSVEERDRIQRNIQRIESTLAYLSCIPETDINVDHRLPKRKRVFRFLDGAVSVSHDYHVMFRLSADREAGYYKISGSYRTMEYNISMIYVDDFAPEKVQEYLYVAGVLLDNEIRKTNKRSYLGKHPTIKQTTQSGIDFSAQYTEDHYIVTFRYDKKIVQLTYFPPEVDAFYYQHIYSMDITGMIDKYTMNYEMKRLLERSTHG